MMLIIKYTNACTQTENELHSFKSLPHLDLLWQFKDKVGFEG